MKHKMTRLDCKALLMEFLATIIENGFAEEIRNDLEKAKGNENLQIIILDACVEGYLRVNFDSFLENMNRYKEFEEVEKLKKFNC